jgi:predicted MPP superfamily phosphohydrolase
VLSTLSACTVDEQRRAAWLEQRRALERQQKRSTPDGPRRKTGTPEPIQAAIRFGLKLAGLWPRCVANGIDVELRTLSLDLPRLPSSFDGYRILHVADPHFDAAPGVTDAIVRSVAGVEADMCVFTGDFRAADEGPFTQTDILEPIAAIIGTIRAPDGCLATLGNHDSADMVPALEQLGLRVLLNEAWRLQRRSETLTVTGVDDVHRFFTPAALAALAAHDRRTFGVILAHSPELAGEAAAAGHLLYLCGHTHGGQLCLPGGWPVVTHLSRHKDLYAGLWRYGELTGYTSRGAGLSTLPIRLNCRPEVTLLVLRRLTQRR